MVPILIPGVLWVNIGIGYILITILVLALVSVWIFEQYWYWLNHHPSMGMNFQSGIGINMAVSVEHFILPHFMQIY